ncbi:unnamed protein product [Rhizophagus irregularis]|uniref:Uncharacterized protein n=1 Tax=Rhizophagus irregularis TaxID=588596 RepID=A0A916E197_9GLOM|nr:unnamed protein product [Rhizophagus irregularis]CAB5349041.1 unnamed protein product [Rhizophagus irregularis]
MLRKIASSYVLQAQEEDIYNADASFPENVRNGSGESSKIATSGEVEGSETIQTSRHSSDLNVQANDQEVDVAEIDNIIAKKRSLDDLEQWKAKFSSDLKSVDADLTFKTVEFLFYLATNVYEVGNTEGPIDDTKYRKDHSKLKVVMKDCLDSLWSKLHFKKVVLEEAFALGIQITGRHGRPFARFSGESFSIMNLVKKIRTIAQKRLNTPSPPSSPLHSTTNSPPSVKKQKQDPFGILDNLY